MIKRILAYVALIRPQSVTLTTMFVFVPTLIETRNITFSLLLILPIMPMISSMIILNDICDIEKDRINKPQRPLVSGMIRIEQGQVLMVLLLLTAIVCALIIYREDWIRLSIFGGATILLALYNLKMRCMPRIKTFATAAIVVLCLSVNYAYYPIMSLYSIFVIAAFFFIIGRELIMDVRDMEGDKQNNYETLAVLFGQNICVCCAIAAFLIALLLCSYIVILRFSPVKSVFLLLSCALILLACKSAIDTKSKLINLYSILLWIPMILMLCIFYL